MPKRKNNNAKKLFILLTLIIAGYFAAPQITSLIIDSECELQENSIRIANWNLQIFGISKTSDSELMNFYASSIKNYDIIFIQEIRDSSETAFPQLCSLLPEYNCEISSRAGRSISKEQIGIIYKKEIELIDFIDFNPDTQDRWERPPIKATFEKNNYEFTTYNIHIKPTDVKSELSHLESIIDNYGNVIVLGDLNADCTYYDANTEKEFNSWHWTISDKEDTTVSKTDCAYDRIIFNSDAKKEHQCSDIVKTGITEKQSDHYLIFTQIETKE